MSASHPIPPVEAEARLSSILPKLGVEPVALGNCYGRVLAGAVVADRALPPFDRVMMDGIALRHAAWRGGRREFHLASTQPAGAPPVALASDEACVEVMTGAVLPRGADAVVPVEQLRGEHDWVRIDPQWQVQPGQFIHLRGSDHAAGAVLLEAGTVLESAELALLAGVGAIEPVVTRQPLLYLLTTGDEVIDPASQPLPWQIRASHPAAVQAAVTARALARVKHLHLPDRREAVEEALAGALAGADLLVFVGGISKGGRDWVGPVLDERLGKPLFRRVSQRAGFPLAAYFEPDRHLPVLALPGNPVSALACTARYLLPALRRMHGEDWVPPQLPLAEAIEGASEHTRLLPARPVDGALEVSQPRNSGDYAALCGYQGVVAIEPGQSYRQGGKPAAFYPWS